MIFHHPPTALPFCSGWCVQSKPCCWYRFSNSINHTTAAINPLGSSSQSCSVSSSVLVVGGWEIQSCHSLSQNGRSGKLPTHPPIHYKLSCMKTPHATFFISRQFHIVIFHHPPTALPFCSGLVRPIQAMLLVQVLQQHQSHHSCYQSPWIIKSKLQCLILRALRSFALQACNFQAALDKAEVRLAVKPAAFGSPSHWGRRGYHGHVEMYDFSSQTLNQAR